jgi:hypothetical protein
MTLFVALIILVMITLLSVSAYRVSNTNLKVVAGMQGRQEALSAVQEVLERVMSSGFFTEQPATVAAEHYGVDVSGDAVEDYSVTLNPPPRCVRTQPVVIGANPTPADLLCAGSARLGSAQISSYCSDTVWELTGNTSDKLTAATTTVRQGVAVRVAITDAVTSCK